MKTLDLKDIKDGTIFQDLCEILLAAEYPDFEPVNDTMGDDGCDGKAENGQRFFQIYYPDVIGNFPDRMDKIKAKIRVSLSKLKRPLPKIWTLITWEKPDTKVNKYVNGIRTEWKAMEIQIWSEPKIRELLAKHHHVYRAWLDRIYGQDIEIIPPEAVTYGNRDNFDALLHLDKKLGKSLNDWQFNKYYKQLHTFDSDGKAAISIIPKSREATEKLPFCSHILLNFSDSSDEVKTQLNAFKDFITKGIPVKLDARALKKVELKFGNIAFRNFDVQNEIKQIEMRSHQGQPIPTTIDLFNTDMVLLKRIRDLQLTRVRGGTEEILLTNEKQSGQFLKFSLTLSVRDPLSQKHTFSVHPDGQSMDAIDGFDYAHTLDCLHRSDTMKVYLNNDFSKSLDFGNVKSSLTDEAIHASLDICSKLKCIQEITHERFPSIFIKPLTEEELSTIEFVYQILTTGTGQLKYEPFVMQLDALAMPVAQMIASGSNLNNKITFEDYEVDLIEKRIDLGPMSSYFDSKPDPDDVKKVQDAIATRKPFQGAIHFIPIDDRIVADCFFHRWLKNAEEIMAEYEKDPKKLS